MGFIQKLAKRNNKSVKTLKPNYSINCECKQYYKARIPRLTWKYVLNLKNWR